MPNTSDVIISITSDGIQYNRNLFPNHTTEQAAQLAAKALKHKTKGGKTLSLNIYVPGQKPRNFIITEYAIEHNYDVDTWHWWFLTHLFKCMKR